MLADLIFPLDDIFDPSKTIGTNKSSCYEKPRWCLAKLSSFKSEYLRRFRPSEQIFPKTNRFPSQKPTLPNSNLNWWVFLSRGSDKMRGRERGAVSGGEGGAREKPPARKSLFCKSQILTSSADGRGVLIGRFNVNHRQFGVTQRRSMQMSETK